MIFVGIFFLIISTTLFFARRNQQHRSFSLKSARPVTAAELEEMAQAIAAEIGGGDWRDYVKLRGTVQAESPLMSKLAEKSCVYYSYRVEREYEETVKEKDANGNLKTVTERKSETISSDRQSLPFTLADQSGQVLIDPDSANIEAIQVANEFLPGEPPGGHLTFGAFSRTLSTQHPSNQRTLGYRLQESVLPTGQIVSVVGAVSDHTGIVTIKKPLKPNHHYIISLKTDEDLIANSDLNIQRLFWGMVGTFGVGVLLIIVGLLR
jgi:hypothetical protein